MVIQMAFTRMRNHAALLGLQERSEHILYQDRFQMDRSRV